MVVSTVSTSPVGTFHVVPPPPPRPAQWSEIVIAIALALLLNLLFILPFLLTNPAPNPPADPPAISVELVPEAQAPPPPPPAPQPEPEEEAKPLQERSFTRSGGEAVAPPGPEAEEEAAAPQEAPEVEPEPEPEPEPEEAQPVEKKKETSPEDIPEWARTVEPSYVVPARPTPPGSLTGSAGGGDPYLNAMWARVRANLVYPPEAGGRSGVTRFEMVLHRSGQVISLKLLTSSGHPALDRAAREAIERSLPFAPFPPEVRAEAVPLIASIPVAP